MYKNNKFVTHEVVMIAFIIIYGNNTNEI